MTNTMKIVVENKETFSFVPTKGTDKSAGYDLYSPDSVFVPVGQVVVINTEISVEIPEGYFGLLCPRSSMGKKGFSLINTIGIIDSDYRGQIILHFVNNGKLDHTIYRGDRVAQLLIVPYISPKIVVVEELSETVRGTGGFGSTGA